MAIDRLGQVGIPVHDLDRAVAFYRDVLALPLLWRGGSLAFFQCGAVRLLLDVPENPAFDHPSSILYFDVADLEAAVAHLDALGVVVRDRPHHIGDLGTVAVWMAFFEDSEGNVLALQSERPLA